MKTLALTAALILFPLIASAQSDYAASWSITGGIGPLKYHTLELDIDTGTRFLSVDGVFRTGTGGATPTTGTCMNISTGGISCNLLSGPIYYVLDIGSNLHGTVKLMDNYTGAVSASAAVQFISIK